MSLTTFYRKQTGRSISLFILKNGNAPIRNRYGAADDTFIISVKTVKDVLATSPPNATNKIMAITTTACSYITFAGISLSFNFVNFFDNKCVSQPRTNDLIGE